MNFQKGHQEAAVWQNGVVYPLGYLPIVTQPSSAAFSINNSGEIVGGSDGIPFVRKGGVLETLLLVNPAGWGSLYGTELEQVNSSGQIIAVAIGADNLQYILLLQPLNARIRQ